MSPWAAMPLWLAGTLLLWTAGAVAFDVVHWVLHQMLGSQSRWLRAFAWPHAVHHRWLDATLATRWEYQWPNVWCHLIPEYLTQLAFSALASLMVPPTIVAGCVVLQTAIFAGLLWYRGLDVNHRAVAMLDAHRPSMFALPAYHALHHVYPDAYFSAYGKMVDWVVGGGLQLRGRRVALVGPAHAFGHELAERLRAAGAMVVEAAPLSKLDVLVLTDPTASEPDHVEPYIDATRSRQLPPEVWAVRTRVDDATARYYHGDVRVIHRTLLVADADLVEAERAARAAERAIDRLQRGAHFVPTGGFLAACRARVAFGRTVSAAPAGATRVPTRAASCAT